MTVSHCLVVLYRTLQLALIELECSSVSVSFSLKAEVYSDFLWTCGFEVKSLITK